MDNSIDVASYKMQVDYYDIGVNIFSKQFIADGKYPVSIMSECRDKKIGMIVISNNMDESYKAQLFVQMAHDAVYPYPTYGTVGIHPHGANKAKKEDFDALREYTKVPNIIAIGECGLDYNRNFSTKENQIRCFEKQICLAEELNLPLYLHERDAVNDFIKRFKNHKDICKKSVVHCFSGTRDTLEKYLDMGFSIGITGWICDDRRAKDLREAVKILPLDRVMIETDAPFLTPMYKGLTRTNYPWNVKYVAEDLAKYMNVGVEELLKATKENTERIFNIGD